MAVKKRGIMPAFIHPPYGVSQLFMESMVNSYRAGVFQHMYTAGSSSRTNAVRTENGRRFLESDAEWIFLVDTDMVWEPGAIITLTQSAKKLGAKAISGWALMPKSGLWPHAVKVGAEGIVPWGAIDPLSEPIQVDAVGGACFLVHRDIYSTVKETYQGKTEYVWQDEVYDETYDMQVGEDITFCQRITEAGYQIWYEPSAIFGHLKPQLLGAGEYSAFQSRLRERLGNN